MRGIPRSVSQSGGAARRDSEAFARQRLTRLRRRSLVLWFLRHQAPMVEEKLAKAGRSRRDYALLLLLGLPFYPLSKPIDTWLRRAPERDWAERGTDRRAGEMFLAFRRPAR